MTISKDKKEVLKELKSAMINEACHRKEMEYHLEKIEILKHYLGMPSAFQKMKRR